MGGMGGTGVEEIRGLVGALLRFLLFRAMCIILFLYSPNSLYFSHFYTPLLATFSSSHLHLPATPPDAVGASVRIPRDAFNQGYGYFEDRRPASNMDPYVVTSKIAETTLLA